MLPNRDYATLGGGQVLSVLRGPYRLVAQTQIRQDRFSGTEIFPFVYLFEAAPPH